MLRCLWCASLYKQHCQMRLSFFTMHSSVAKDFSIYVKQPHVCCGKGRILWESELHVIYICSLRALIRSREYTPCSRTALEALPPSTFCYGMAAVLTQSIVPLNRFYRLQNLQLRSSASLATIRHLVTVFTT